MKLFEITNALESWAPRQLQEGYDNARLITGHLDQEIKQALATLDCTEAVVDEAIAKSCELIIAHHPIVFKGLKSLTGANYVERTIIKAIKHDIAIYAVHTNLDSVYSGVNAMIGQKLNLEDLEILRLKPNMLCKLYTYAPAKDAEQVRQALFSAGAGHIGNYDHCSFSSPGTGTFRASEGSNPHVGEIGEEHHEAELKIEVIFPEHLTGKVLKALRTNHPYEEVAYDLVKLENVHQYIGSGMVGKLQEPMSSNAFLKHVKTSLNTAMIRHTQALERPIQKVAFCGGAGSFLLGDAMAHKADAYITGDFKYHEFFDADQKIMILDVGHFESEQFTPLLIQQKLLQYFPTFAVLLSEVKTNPVQYF